MANISNKDERNQLNLTIRQQPWYQQWFAQRGLNPNQVQLTDQQRKELQQLVVQNGFLDPSNGHIDPAGNVSDFHGWKGLPTAAKIAIGAGVTAATLGAGGALAGGGGLASGAAGGGVSAATGAGATAAGTGGSILGTLGGSKAALLGMGLSTAGKLASGAMNQRAQDRGAQAEYDTARVPIQNAQSLQYAQARLGADQSRMAQVAGADMLGNSKPPTDPRAKLSGAGYMNPETIAMMRERAMSALQSGSDIPQMQTMPDQPGGGATKTDGFLKALTMGSTALGALNESGVLKRNPQPIDPDLNAANEERVNDIYGKVRFF